MDIREQLELSINIIEDHDAPIEVRREQVMRLFHLARGHARALFGVSDDESADLELRQLARQQVETLQGAITEFLTRP